MSDPKKPEEAPPPRAKQEEEDDLDDLDDVLEQFSSPSPSAQQPSKTSTSSSTNTASASAASTLPASGVPAGASAGERTGPEEKELADYELDDLLSEDFAKELAQGMEALMRELGPAGTGSGMGMGAGEPAAAGGSGGGGAPGSNEGPVLDEEALMKQFERLMMGQGFPEGADDAGAAAQASGSRSPGGTTAPQGTKPSFQDAIRQTMDKLKDSDQNARASSSRPNDPLAALLQQMGGEGGGLPGLGEGGFDPDNPELANMLEQMMEELMSKEILYEPLKELGAKYPAWLEEHKSSLSTEDYERYSKQADYVKQVLAVFEDPEYDAKDGKEQERRKKVVELMNQMQDQGAPPEDIIGDLPPGFSVGDDGMPKLPENMSGEDCVIA